jgi:hypothetical protein
MANVREQICSKDWEVGEMYSFTSTLYTDKYTFIINDIRDNKIEVIFISDLSKGQYRKSSTIKAYKLSSLEKELL